MPGQASPFYVANKDGNTATVVLQVPINAGYCVGYDGNLPTAGGDILGIVLQDGLVDDPVGAVKDNEASAIVGAAVTNGQSLEVDASGRLIPLAAGTRVAIARDDSNAADLYIKVDLDL